uniref:DUF3591 domain-containing protein n=1 Tax=Elaeophora elaphi TaxID=1147741 RepID=A0A0R3S5K2_9BILA
MDYGFKDREKSTSIKHLLQTCSDLKYNDNLYGITYFSGHFPVIFSNTLDSLKRDDGVARSISSLFYHKLLANYRQMVSSKRSSSIDKIRAECINQSLVGDSCVAMIEGRKGFIPHFKVGLFRKSDLAQFEATDLVKNYFPEQDYQYVPIDYLALENKRSCRPRFVEKVESDSDEFFDFSECITLATPDFYYQLCCCDESLEVCGSLEDELWIDPSIPIFLVNDSLDEPHKLAEYGLDENSVRRNYRNKLDERYKKKPQIVCAIGTLTVNETLREKRSIDEAFPSNVRSCRSVYHYRKRSGEELQMRKSAMLSKL